MQMFILAKPKYKKNIHNIYSKFIMIYELSKERSNIVTLVCTVEIFIGLTERSMYNFKPSIVGFYAWFCLEYFSYNSGYHLWPTSG